MPSTIITKNSITASAVPVSGDLTRGELALNLTDGRIYSRDEGTTIVELGINPSTIAITAGTINNAVIGATTAVAGTFTNLTATGTLTGTLATDAQPNITSLGTIASLVATTADINGGTIDGTVIGGATPAAATVTTFTSTGIDDNATSTAITIDASENVGIGERLHTGTASADSRITIGNIGTENTNSSSYIRAVSNLLIYNSASDGHRWEQGGSEKMRIDSSGSILFGSAGQGYISGTVGNTYNSGYNQDDDSWATWMNYYGYQNGATRYRDFIVGDGKAGRIATFDGSSGNVGIGTDSPASFSGQTSLTVRGTSVGRVDVQGASGAGGGALSATSTSMSLVANYNIPLTLSAGTLSYTAFNTSGTERFRISADGSLSTPTLGTSNVRFGVNAGNSIASGGNNNTVVGDEAGTSVTTGVQNTLIGSEAGDALTVGVRNVAVGFDSLSSDTQGSKSIAIGRSALATQNFTSATDAYNVAVGDYAGAFVTTGTNNTLIGGLAGSALTTGANNTFVGVSAGGVGVVTGNSNNCVGVGALQSLTSGANNSTLGDSAGTSVNTGSNNLLLGHDAGRTGSPGGNVTAGSNVIVLGDENITSAQIKVDWTVVSDARDKTDFTALDLGLDFVNALAPVTYKWDMRSKYGDKSAEGYDLAAQTPDGTHKEDWLDIGFKAQDVEALEIAAGYKIADKTNLTTSLTSDGQQMGLQYSKFVPILVKAIQEQQALIVELEARLSALEV